MTSQTDLTGTRLGNYRLIRLLGRGRMGQVYLAQDEALLRPTAVKIMSWSSLGAQPEKAEDWFLSEARSVARVNHPAVVQVYGIARHGDYCYIAMEYVDGASGDVLVAERGPLSSIDATQIVMQIAGAVDQAHACGIIHRDIKPANVFIKADRTAKLGDFGMALQAETRPAKPSPPVGSPHYIAPELWQGAPGSVQTDLYALGATYFYLLTGRPPFDVHDLDQLIVAHQTAPIPDPGLLKQGISSDVARIIQGCLAKQPQDRYRSAQELAWELRGALRRLKGRTPIPVVAQTGPMLKIAVQNDATAPWITALGMVARPFGQVDPSHCPYHGPPLSNVRDRLKEFVCKETGGTLVLVGARGCGRSTLARQTLPEVPAETPLSCLDLGYGTLPLKPGQTLPQWACRALGAVPSYSPGRDVYLEGLIEQLSSGPLPALLLLDSVPDDPPYAAQLSSLVRAARSTKCMSLIMVGTPALATQLTALSGLDASDITTLEVPSLNDAETAAYVEAWLESTRDPGRPPLMMTPDAVTLVNHRSEGNLVRINTIASNMLQLAAVENRRVLTSWYAWRAPLDPAWVANKDTDLLRPPGWPTPEVLEVLNNRRQKSGLPQRAAPTP